MIQQKTMLANRDTIIIVDDNITNLTAGANSLTGQYNVLTAPSGQKLFVLLEKVKPALILLDIEMPEMNGYEVMKILKSKEKTAHIPVIFLTAKIDPESEVQGLNLGAVDYITKPFSRELLAKRIDLHIQLEKQKLELASYNLTLENEVEKKTRTVTELKNAILKTVAELVESRDRITGGHIERTQHYLRLLVDFLLEHNVYTDEISSWDIDLVIMSSQLHDVGKISIKDSILMKPGKLTGEEFEEMKKHTLFGVDIIRKIERSATDNEFLLYAEIFAGSHHEKWDGTGYPYGLKGEEIPLQGRLMAIVDVYDALTDDRPYKEAFTHEQSIDIISKGSGTHFDPSIADIFLMHEQEFKNARNDKPLGGLQSSLNFPSTLTVMANIMDIKGGGRTKCVHQCLEVFVKALSTHDVYKNEVSGWNIDFFLMSAQLHDVGKIAVDNNILNKTGELTKDEYEYVKSHVDSGIKAIHQSRDNVAESNLLRHAEFLAGCHHEKWDGTGYPQGLKGKGIPLQGRIMAIIDVYSALVTDRPHRRKKTHKEAVDIICRCSGTHFEPDLINVFLDHENEFEKAGKFDEMRGQ